MSVKLVSVKAVIRGILAISAMDVPEGEPAYRVTVLAAYKDLRFQCDLWLDTEKEVQSVKIGDELIIDPEEMIAGGVDPDAPIETEGEDLPAGPAV